MKSESKKSSAGMIASWAIGALVVAGAVAVWGVADFSEKSTVMSKAFILFIGAVIAVQVVPGIMLLAAMLKGVASMATKKVEVKVGAGRK